MMNDIDLWFEDECHFQQHGSRCAMWIPPEDTDPVVLQEPTRKGIGIFGAVRMSDGCLVTSREKTFNTMTFLCFMEKLLPFRKHGRKMVVILDNARWHHARALTPMADRASKYLPARLSSAIQPRFEQYRKGMEADTKTMHS